MRTEPVRAGEPGAPGLGSGGSPGRAGRNLPIAIGVGVGIAVLAALTLYTVRWTFVLVVMAAVGLGLRELVAALRVRQIRVPLLPIALGGMATQAVAWGYGADGLVAAAAGTAVLTAAWRVFLSRPHWLRDAVAGALLVGYVPLLAGCVTLLARPDDGAERVVAFAVATICSDVGAYAVGVLFGRHLMVPSISPKKTWEGFAGSLGAATAGGIVTLTALFGAPVWQGAVFGVVAAIAATAGDLGESYFKRRLGLKDMSALLPGHGGVMDRADSLLPTALVSLLLLLAFTPPP